MSGISSNMSHATPKVCLAQHRVTANQKDIDPAASASGKCNRALAILATVAAGLAVVAFALLAGCSLAGTIMAGVSGAGAPAIIPGVAATLLFTGAAIFSGVMCFNAARLI